MPDVKNTDLTGSDMLQRSPARREFRSTTDPLIVTPTLVSRVDDTPRSVRPQDGGSAVGRDGKEVDNPDAHPEQLAIEPDPNRAFEHWDEYWRKIHGPKFAYEEPGSTSQLVLRYDQLHRLAGGPSSFFRPPYRAMVDSIKKSSLAIRLPACRHMVARGGTDWPTSPIGPRTISKRR